MYQNAHRALILDFNDEYGEFGVKSIALEHVPVFMVHPVAEIRRIRPFVMSGGKWKKMSTNDMVLTLEKVVNSYKGGALLIEDINKYVDTVMPSDLTGILASNAHSDLDLILHYQSVARPLPTVWQNTNIIRYHCQYDPVEKSKIKLSEMLEIFQIAEILVNEQYFIQKNQRFFVYVDKDAGTIIGNFTYQMFDKALEEYINTNSSQLKPWLQRKNENGKAVYTWPAAMAECKKRMVQKYWGNNPSASTGKRESKTMVATGRKRVGKSFETMRYLREDYCVNIA